MEYKRKIMLVFALAFALATGLQLTASQTIRLPQGMVPIPEGSFQMGTSCSVDGHPDERPVHAVYVSAFYMDAHEVTKALWDEVASWAQDNGYDISPSDTSGKAKDHPVYGVNWYEAVKWCNARSEKEGLTPAYYISSAKTAVYRTGQVNVRNEWVRWGSGYRLPTEAEWEKAARGGCERRIFPWCDTETIQHTKANYDCSGRYTFDMSNKSGLHPDFLEGDPPYTSPAGSFPPNGYGLFDMAGNVVEWCWDWYSERYYASSLGTDPRGPGSGSSRVIRGGNWHSDAYFCRAAFRGKSHPVHVGSGLGFRTVLSRSP